MRNGKYHEWLTDEGLTKVQGWARDGLTNEQIAHNIGITTTTLYEWSKQYAEFSAALKKGKEVVDMEVENALLKRAMGYQATEKKYEYMSNGEQILIETKTKDVAPDTGAIAFWLKNRKPDTWRDSKAIEHAGELNHNVTNLSPEDRQRRIDELMSKLPKDDIDDNG